MPSRYLRETILTSDGVNKLSFAAEVFYRRLMSVVDDFGRFDARETVLRGALYVLKADAIRLSDVSEWLKECVGADLITLYESDGKPYLVLHKLGEPRAKSSKFPPPPSGLRDESVIPFTDKEKSSRAQVVVNTSSVYKSMQAHTDANGCEHMNASVPITNTITNSNTSTPGACEAGDGLDAVLTVEQLPPPAEDWQGKATAWLSAERTDLLRYNRDLAELSRATGSLKAALSAAEPFLHDPKIRNPFAYVLPKVLDEREKTKSVRPSIKPLAKAVGFQ